MHKTKNLDDGYIGSGKLLRRAIKKHGLENFSTIILHIFDEEWKMKIAEKILVVPDKETSYNLCPGGHGGFGYINKNRLNRKFNINDGIRGRNNLLERMRTDPEYKEWIRKRCSTSKIGRLPTTGTSGKKFSNKTKNKMSESQRGSRNSQFGTIWVTNGIKSIKIQKEQIDFYESMNYRRGRNMGH